MRAQGGAGERARLHTPCSCAQTVAVRFCEAFARPTRSADTLSLTDVANEMATGKAYVHTHPDVAGRPVVVIRAARHVIGAWAWTAGAACVGCALGGQLRPPTPSAMRPIALLSIPPGASPPVESQKLCAFLLDSALERLPEGEETFLGIFDLRGFTPANADLVFARFMVGWGGGACCGQRPGASALPAWQRHPHRARVCPGGCIL